MLPRLLLAILLASIVLLPLPPSGSPTRVSASGRTAAFGYGTNIGDLALANLITDLGFGYMKETLSWARSEPVKGQYQWLYGPNDADNIANVAQANNLKLLLRVDNPPAWANGTGGTAPPTNANDFGDFLYALASHLKGKVAAYEIWNEPNLALEWGGSAPNPERYAQILITVYPRIKSGDPNALVVSAGLATNGEHSGSALDDLEFIQRVYNAGAKNYFDVLGSHPYGFAYAPEYDPGAASGLAFRRAEQQHGVMVANGDGNKQVWATEFGWLLESPYSWPDRDWQKVSESTQADYLVRAYQYAVDNWPWMGVMFQFNLDYGANYYQAGCPGNSYMDNPMRYYSITYRSNPCSPGTSQLLYRQAYSSLKAMPKYLGDTTPPTASMSTLSPGQTHTWFVVSWQGADDLSGIAYFDVQYKDGSSGAWQSWLSGSAGTSGLFANGVSGHTYYFQVRAADKAGNIGGWSASVSTTAGSNSSGLSRLFLPVTTRQYSG